MDDHGHDHNGKNIGWAILINIGITIAEAIGGTLSGSLALLSDAGHNLSDVISLALSFIGEKISGRKATRRHTFGFKRTEIFTALINSLSLVGIAVFIVVEALKRLSAGSASWEEQSADSIVETNKRIRHYCCIARLP